MMHKQNNISRDSNSVENEGKMSSKDPKQDIVNIGIKHGFSCINIRQVPREVLKRPEAAVFNTSLRTWRMLMY